MNKISTRFSKISPNFGDEIFYNISRKWMNKISTKFCEILVMKFCERNRTKFREIFFTKFSQNFAKLNLLSHLFRISRNKKNWLSWPPYSEDLALGIWSQWGEGVYALRWVYAAAISLDYRLKRADRDTSKMKTTSTFPICNLFHLWVDQTAPLVLILNAASYRR
jgi:hypothetical protein